MAERKVNFGAYAILEPVKYQFAKMPEWYWVIEPPTSRDELQMAKFYNAPQITIGPAGTSRPGLPTWIETAHREIALTFGGTNIPLADVAVEDGGEPLVKVGMSVDEIEAILGAMPQEIVSEIWAAIGAIVPTWGPYKGEPTDSKN
ncbi:MAG: hypothetical protein A2Y38_06810 [Spirochaetes bacterium GWB1_59_5]|nr:MAG: hypothetical protein A2Y38_06810 [Spirochaetes bacterium GWB1_59_5]